MRKRGKELLILALLLLPALVTVLPLFLLLTGSLMDVQEIRERLMPVFTGEGSLREEIKDLTPEQVKQVLEYIETLKQQ